MPAPTPGSVPSPVARSATRLGTERSWRRAVALLGATVALGLVLGLVGAEPALADNCQTPSDCFSTADAASEALLGILFLEALSFVLSMIPFVGWAKGVVEAGSGEDLITGRKLSDAERYAGAIPWGKLAIGAAGVAGLAGAGFAVARRAGRGGRGLTEADLIRRANQGLPPPRRGAEDVFPGLRSIRSRGGIDCPRCSVQSLDAIRGRPIGDVPPQFHRGASLGMIREHISRRVAPGDLADFRWRHGVGSRPDQPGGTPSASGWPNFDPMHGRSQVEAALRARGEGSQAILNVNLRNGDAHVFNAVYQDGRVHFLDRQVPGGEWSRSQWGDVTDISILHVPESYFR